MRCTTRCRWPPCSTWRTGWTWAWVFIADEFSYATAGRLLQAYGYVGLAGLRPGVQSGLAATSRE